MVIFAPVLLWNMRNGWASFIFQGSNRWSGRHYFSLHLLIGWILLLLTPTGLLGMVQVFLPKRLKGAALSDAISSKQRQYLWAVVFTLVPLSVFVIYSLLNKPKLNWTAPVWLAAIPLLAWNMVPHDSEVKGLLARFTRRMWMPTIVALLFIHGGSFYYIAKGLPGAGPMSAERLFGEWRALADSVNTIRQDLEKKIGAKPIIVGMDKNFISSELSFYDFPDHDGPVDTAGPHLFGSASLMWAFWFPRSAAAGRNILMIDFNQKSLTNPFLSQNFEAISEVFRETIKKDGRVVGYFYWRVGYRYRG
jgi:dolichol-phosphate mannosyltransferase